ncbi:hypothetical protein HQ560_16815, partial [bacterium]|nr:hypothetical protein [bacterium]
MLMRRQFGVVILLAMALGTAHAGQAGKSPVKVFILAGQSNMVGAGCVDFPASRAASYKKRGMTDEAIAEKRRGALDSVAKRAPYKHIADKDGKWTVRDDVWVYFDRGRGEPKKGALTAGYGSRDDRIGPEFGFGHVMGEALDSQA